MKDLIDGETWDSEKAALVEFSDLLDLSDRPAFAGNDKQVSCITDALREIRTMIADRPDVSFCFSRFVDGRDYPKLASTDDVEIIYQVEGPAELVTRVEELMQKARGECLKART